MPRSSRCRTVDWDWESFLYDRFVMSLDAQQLGVWVRLLGAFALAEVPGELPGDERTLQRASGATDDEWAPACQGILLALQHRNGVWVHARTFRDHEDQTRRLEMYKSRSGLGNKKRWGSNLVPNASLKDPLRIEEGVLKPSPPSLLHSYTPIPPESQNQDLLSNGVGRKRVSSPKKVLSPEAVEFVESFEVFWTDYPRKQKRLEAEKAWSKIQVKTEEYFHQIMLGLEKWKVSRQWQDPQYIQLASSWINSCQWDDEIPEASHVRF
jgi:hypothetical protein